MEGVGTTGKIMLVILKQTGLGASHTLTTYSISELNSAFQMEFWHFGSELELSSKYVMGERNLQPRSRVGVSGWKIAKSKH